MNASAKDPFRKTKLNEITTTRRKNRTPLKVKWRDSVEEEKPLPKTVLKSKNNDKSNVPKTLRKAPAKPGNFIRRDHEVSMNDKKRNNKSISNDASKKDGAVPQISPEKECTNPKSQSKIPLYALYSPYRSQIKYKRRQSKEGAVGKQSQQNESILNRKSSNDSNVNSGETSEEVCIGQNVIIGTPILTEGNKITFINSSTDNTTPNENFQKKVKYYGSDSAISGNLNNLSVLQSSYASNHKLVPQTLNRRHSFTCEGEKHTQQTISIDPNTRGKTSGKDQCSRDFVNNIFLYDGGKNTGVVQNAKLFKHSEEDTMSSGIADDNVSNNVRVSSENHEFTLTYPFEDVKNSILVGKCLNMFDSVEQSSRFLKNIESVYGIQKNQNLPSPIFSESSCQKCDESLDENKSAIQKQNDEKIESKSPNTQIFPHQTIAKHDELLTQLNSEKSLGSKLSAQDISQGQLFEKEIEETIKILSSFYLQIKESGNKNSNSLPHKTRDDLKNYNGEEVKSKDMYADIIFKNTDKYCENFAKYDMQCDPAGQNALDLNSNMHKPFDPATRDFEESSKLTKVSPLHEINSVYRPLLSVSRKLENNHSKDSCGNLSPLSKKLTAIVDQTLNTLKECELSRKSDGVHPVKDAGDSNGTMITPTENPPLNTIFQKEIRNAQLQKHDVSGSQNALDANEIERTSELLHRLWGTSSGNLKIRGNNNAHPVQDTCDNSSTMKESLNATIPYTDSLGNISEELKATENPPLNTTFQKEIRNAQLQKHGVSGSQNALDVNEIEKTNELLKGSWGSFGNLKITNKQGNSKRSIRGKSVRVQQVCANIKESRHLEMVDLLKLQVTPITGIWGRVRHLSNLQLTVLFLSSLALCYFFIKLDG